MKYEIFCLNDLSLKGEGNLHIIVLNERTGHVFRFLKGTSTSRELPDGDTIKKQELNIHKIYKVGVNFKKYNVIQKFWGKIFLPKTENEERAGLMPSKLIEEIAVYIEDQRAEFRKHRSIITKTDYIEIQPDLTRFPPEYRHYINAVTFCVELKPKFGMLFQSRDSSNGNCLNKCSRFCLIQKKREESNRTEYCPCDFFSGNPNRMKRAIKELIINSQDKLRIFQDGNIIHTINEDTITNIMMQLGLDKEGDNTELVDKFCDLIIQAVRYDKSGSGALVQLPFNVSTTCQAHSWSISTTDDTQSDSIGIYNGSVLGRLIHTDCLLDATSEEMNSMLDQLNEFLVLHNIKRKENVFDLWNAHLISMDLPANIRDIVRTLKKYVVSLTIRDCSLMIKFCKTSAEMISNLDTKEDNSMILIQSDGSPVLSSIEIIDVSIKPLSKIKYNCQLEEDLRSIFD